MAYIDSINNDSTDYAINSFANLLTASGSASGAKTVTFPNGYDVTEGSTMTFRVLFPNGHTGQSNMTLNGKAVVVNKHGTLIPLPYHNISSTYTSLQPNTILEMYYTSNYDGNNTSAFVIVGNPIVISSDNYVIYADGNNPNEQALPVGSVYMNATTTTLPSSISFIGTWVSLNNTFLRATTCQSCVSKTGGSDTKTLVACNLPAHCHSGCVGSHSHCINIKSCGMSANATGDIEFVNRNVSMILSGGSNNLTYSSGNLSFGSSHLTPTENWAVQHADNNGVRKSIHIDVSHTHSIIANTCSCAPSFTGDNVCGTCGCSFDVKPFYTNVAMWYRSA